jgi:head-tail adaptor
MTTPIRVKRRKETIINGSPKVTFEDADPSIDFCNWKGKGGTESTQSGTLVVEDTADVVMWYRPDISQKDRLLLNDDPKLAYDVVGPPDNVEQRNMFLVLKVKRAVNT